MTAARVTIVVGDFFATTAAALGPLDGFYDRAAMIALPPPLRTRYVAHLRTLLAPAARGLLITFDYPPGAMDGPPFPVVPDDVHAAWAGATVVELAARAADSARLQAQGVTAIERAYAIAT